MDLSEKDRWMIANQLKILESLYPEEAEVYSVQRKAIERGYKLHYLGLTQYFEKEMSEEKCNEVIEILNMYRAITFSYQQAEDKEGLEQSDIRFEGFDGNEEGEQFANQGRSTWPNVTGVMASQRGRMQTMRHNMHGSSIALDGRSLTACCSVRNVSEKNIAEEGRNDVGTIWQVPY